MSPKSHELAATYATLILADDNMVITSDKIIALTTAAGLEIEPIWASLLEKALVVRRIARNSSKLSTIIFLQGKDTREILINIGGGGAPAAAAVAPIAGGGGGAAEVPKAEEKKEEAKEESDDDMVRPGSTIASHMNHSEITCSRASVCLIKRICSCFICFVSLSRPSHLRTRYPSYTGTSLLRTSATTVSNLSTYTYRHAAQ